MQCSDTKLIQYNPDINVLHCSEIIHKQKTGEQRKPTPSYMLYLNLVAGYPWIGQLSNLQVSRGEQQDFAGYACHIEK